MNPMTCLRTAAAALFVCGMGTPAFAQPAQVSVPADKDWEHQWTAMTFPARVDNFQRESVTAFEERETNISSRYWDEETQTILSIYIYRPGNPEVSIWFDRALYSLGAHNVLGAVDLDTMKIGTFTPSGGTAKSGQFAVLAVDGDYRSTALSLYRAGEWLVKLRISSRELSVSQMDDLLKRTIAVLPELEDLNERPAYFVEECTTALQFAQAEPFEDPKGDSALALEASLNVISQFLGNEEHAEKSAQRYCRVGQRQGQFNVYRPDESSDAYTVAIGDSGRGFSVQSGQLYGAEPGGASAVSIYRVESATGLETRIHRPFEGLPDINNAANAVFRQPALASVTRPLGDETPGVTLFTSSGEDNEPTE